MYLKHFNKFIDLNALVKKHKEAQKVVKNHISLQNTIGPNDFIFYYARYIFAEGVDVFNRAVCCFNGICFA